MTEIILGSAAFDVLLADLEPKPCDWCDGTGKEYPDATKRQPASRVLCSRCKAGIVPGVAVISLEAEPTEPCPACDGVGRITFTTELKHLLDSAPCPCSVRTGLALLPGTDSNHVVVSPGRVLARRLTIREADQPCPNWCVQVGSTRYYAKPIVGGSWVCKEAHLDVEGNVPGRSVAVRVIGWADGQMEVEKA